MPAPITSFTQTADEEGSAVVTLSWAHAGTDLDRFEVLTREEDSEPWVSYALAPAADFGTGPYVFEVGSFDDQEWTVRALSATGAPSTNNPKVKRLDKTHGAWLLPYRHGKLDRNLHVKIDANAMDFDVPVDSETFSSPGRAGKIVQFGKQHGHEGIVSGHLLGFTDPVKGTISRRQCKRRLRKLIRKQHRYRIVFVSRDFHFRDIVFPEGHGIAPVLAPNKLYTVEVPILQVFRRKGRKR